MGKDRVFISEGRRGGKTQGLINAQQARIDTLESALREANRVIAANSALLQIAIPNDSKDHGAWDNNAINLRARNKSVFERNAKLLGGDDG